MRYHHNLQGFIYRLIKFSGYDGLHDRRGCKFFSFSNLIPPSRTVQPGSLKNLVIASPDSDFVRAVQSEAKKVEGTVIKIGAMNFRLLDSRLLDARLPEDFEECRLIAGTPIVVRIPRYRLPEYGIKPARDYEYVYWRKDYTPTAFVKQLEENLIKKYKEYCDMEAGTTMPLFEKLRFKKQVAIPLEMKGQEATIIGTLWDFHFNPLNGLKRDILQFGLDAGIGEMNSLGFGFMNLMKGDIHREEAI